MVKATNEHSAIQDAIWGSAAVDLFHATPRDTPEERREKSLSQPGWRLPGDVDPKGPHVANCCIVGALNQSVGVLTELEKLRTAWGWPGSHDAWQLLKDEIPNLPETIAIPGIVEPVQTLHVLSAMISDYDSKRDRAERLWHGSHYDKRIVTRLVRVYGWAYHRCAAAQGVQHG